jgi:hypothetical protein
VASGVGDFWPSRARAIGPGVPFHRRGVEGTLLPGKSDFQLCDMLQARWEALGLVAAGLRLVLRSAPFCNVACSNYHAHSYAATTAGSSTCPWASRRRGSVCSGSHRGVEPAKPLPRRRLSKDSARSRLIVKAHSEVYEAGCTEGKRLRNIAYASYCFSGSPFLAWNLRRFGPCIFLSLRRASCADRLPCGPADFRASRGSRTAGLDGRRVHRR